MFIVAALLVVVSVIGSVMPGLPGPPLGYIGLLLLNMTDKVQHSTTFFVVWGVVVLVVSVLDYYIPIRMTRGLGGSSYGVKGSVIGMLAGMIFTPIGVILGTLAGAVIGEMMGGSDFRNALRSGFGAFVGTMLSTGIKLVVSIMFVIYYIIDLF